MEKIRETTQPGTNQWPRHLMGAGVSLSLSRDGVRGERIFSSFSSLISDPFPRDHDFYVVFVSLSRELVSLCERNSSGNRFSEDLRRGLFQQRGLSGVFHRDLVPENCLSGENGGLKVSDLLLTLWGTPVAPEILTIRGYDVADIDDLDMPEFRIVIRPCAWSYKSSDLLESSLSELDLCRSKDEGRPVSSIFGHGVPELDFSIFRVVSARLYSDPCLKVFLYEARCGEKPNSWNPNLRKSVHMGAESHVPNPDPVTVKPTLISSPGGPQSCDNL